MSKETSSDLVSLFLAVLQESFCYCHDAERSGGSESGGGGGGNVHRSESDDGFVRFPVISLIWEAEVATIEAGTVFNSAFMNADPMSSQFISSQKEVAHEKVIGTTAFGLWAKKSPLHHFEMAFLPNVILEGGLRAHAD